MIVGWALGIGVADVKGSYQLFNDVKSGSGTLNVQVTSGLGLTSYFTKVPIGPLYGGANWGSELFQHFVPPPKPSNF